MRRCMSGIFIFSWLLFVSLASGQEPDLQIDVLSVGQADAQLIFTKDKVLLIDIGGQVAGPKKQFEYVFSKLKELTGKDNIDYFVVTHYHTDHLGNLYANSSKGFGLWGLVEEKGVTIGTVIDRGDDVNFGSPTSTYNHYKPAIDRWLQQGKVHNRAKAHLGDQQILLGNGVKIEVVAVNGNEVLNNVNARNPQRFVDFPPSENDYSVALKITLGDFEYFTGGDLSGKDTERREFDPYYSDNDIESSIADRVGDIEVYRADHHGSAYSSNPTFIEKLDPEFSLISSGKNGYGHPDTATVGRLLATSTVLITSDVSETKWSSRPNIRDHIVGDIEIKVFEGGKRYTVNGVEARSLSTNEEINGQDGPGGSTIPQTAITPQEAFHYDGQEVTVRGTIISYKKLRNIAFLNFSRDYTNDLSLVIFRSDFGKFRNGFEPFVGKTVTVIGKVTTYEGRPQMQIKRPAEIKLGE